MDPVPIVIYPESQGVQIAAPDNTEYVLKGHSMQNDARLAPVVEEAVPAAQFVHID